MEGGAAILTRSPHHTSANSPSSISQIISSESMTPVTNSPLLLAAERRQLVRRVVIQPTSDSHHGRPVAVVMKIATPWCIYFIFLPLAIPLQAAQHSPPAGDGDHGPTEFTHLVFFLFDFRFVVCLIGAFSHPPILFSRFRQSWGMKPAGDSHRSLPV